MSHVSVILCVVSSEQRVFLWLVEKPWHYGGIFVEIVESISKELIYGLIQHIP